MIYTLLKTPKEILLYPFIEEEFKRINKLLGSGPSLIYITTLNISDEGIPFTKEFFSRVYNLDLEFGKQYQALEFVKNNNGGRRQPVFHITNQGGGGEERMDTSMHISG